MSTKIQSGSNAAGVANVDDNYNLNVVTPGFSSGGVTKGGGPENAGAVGFYSVIDEGEVTGVRDVLSPETDLDYRLRVSHDNFMDGEDFSDTAQNTGKFNHTFTTLTATISSSGLLTNSGNITTTSTGMTFSSNSFVPVAGTQTYVNETSIGFTAQPNANTVFDFGAPLKGAANPYIPQDGPFFRITSAGMFGVISKAGVETTTAVFPNALGTGAFVYTNNQNYRCLVQMNNVSTTFWINNAKMGEIPNPLSGGFPCQSRSLAWGFRHSIVGGTAGSPFQALITGYRIYIRGAQFSDSLGTIGNRVYGSYQGLSGATMGQLVAGTVTTGTLVKPTAAIPVNTSLAANLPNSLGGRIYEQLASGLAANVDGIFASYTNPAASLTVQARRLKITGIMLSGNVSTVVVGGSAFTEWYIAFGHTADSLATTESASFASATTKAPRRFMLPKLTSNMTANQAAGTLLVQPEYETTFFESPIYVNPGERIALVGNKTITGAITSGVLSYTYQFIYAPE